MIVVAVIIVPVVIMMRRFAERRKLFNGRLHKLVYLILSQHMAASSSGR